MRKPDFLRPFQLGYYPAVSHAVKQLALVERFQQSEGEQRGKEVSELTAHNGVVIVHASLIKTTGSCCRMPP